MKKHQFYRSFACLLCISLLVSPLAVSFVSAESHPPEFEFTDLGTQLEWVRISQIDVTQNEAGDPLLHAVMEGKPAKLVIIDLNTNTILNSIPVTDTVDGKEETTEGLRGVAVAPDGTAYTGGYFSNHLFKHEPGTDYVTSLGPPAPGERQVWKMVSGEDGKIYGGTYGSGKGWIYDPSTEEFTNLGSILPPQAYVYSIDYDDEADTIYFGMGAEAHLIKYDVQTGEQKEISLGDYQDMSFVFDLTVTGDKIFALMSPGSDTLVIDKETEEIEYVIPRILSRGGVSDKDPDDSKVYYTQDQTVFYYDIDEKEHQTLDFHLGGEASGFGFVELDDPKFPGYTLVGITREGRLFKYHPETDYREIVPMPIDGEPGELHSVAAGPDGKIHMSAYLGAGAAIYDPNKGETTTFTAADVGVDQVLYQAEKILPYGDKILYGKYTGAVIYSFDPDLPWDMKGDQPNPEVLFTVGEDQDRPFAMLGLEDQDKLFVGTVPTYGELGGALTVYDFKNDTKDVYRNIIPNQSIIALAHKDGLIYGGTSVAGGLGIDPTEEEAKLFIWDIENEQKVYEGIPVPTKNAISALMVGPDENIWGIAGGTLFIMDPDSREIIYSEDKFDRYMTSSVWRDATLEIGTDGHIYGTISGQFFMIDAETKEVHILRESEERIFLTQDPFGHFYFIEGEKLYKASAEELAIGLESVILEADQTALSPGGATSLTLSGEMSDGSEASLENARIEYRTNQPDLVDIDDNGQLTLTEKVGDVRSFQVWADVTLAGTEVSSNVLEFVIAVSAPLMLDTLEDYREEILSEEAYRSLKIHLTAVARFEQQASGEKVVKHMESFKRLLAHQRDNEWISETVYDTLRDDANALIQKWEGNIPLRNPGFEAPVLDGQIPGWQQVYGEGKMTVVDAMAYTGNYSLHVSDDDDKSYGMESDPVEVTGGYSYTASVMTYVKSGKPSIYIRFYDSDHERIDQKAVSGGSEGEWTKLSVTATAPEETVYASVLLYSTTTGRAEAYFDDVRLNKEPGDGSNTVKIGTPIMSVTIPGASYGKGPGGDDWIYAVTNGNPAILNVIDASTGERVNSFELAGVHNSWGSAVARDGTVYIGTQRNGYLYRWVPGNDDVDNLGPAIDGETHIWRVTTDSEGRVYGGTYPNGKVFQYDPGTNTFHDYGPLIEGVQYVRSIAFGNGKIYAGLGTPAHLVELDPESGDKRVISLPEGYQDEQYVYDISYAGDLVFARMTPANVTLVYDLVQNEWVDTIDNTIGIDVSPRGPDNKVYLRKDSDIYAYDLTTRELTSTGVTFFGGGSSSRGFGWIELSEADYPGESLVSIDSRGNVFIYNPQSGHYKTVQGDVEGQPNDIQSLARGPDGNIYIGGYLSPQGMSVYNPDTEEFKQLPGIGQIEGMGVHRHKMYMGTYPGAHIYEYDPAEPWDFGTNPEKLFSLSGEHKQDRPFAFVSTGDHLAIGTVPDYGELGGALTLFDPDTGQYDVHRHIVKNQSIIELQAKDGLIYGGTSIWGGYGIEPTESEAKLFIWDTDKKDKVWEGVPIPGEEAVSAITFDDDGFIWGLTAGHVFKFDPTTKEVVQSKELFSYGGGDMYYRGRDLVFDDDGYLYGTTLGKVFKLDPKSWEVDVLTDDAALFAQDRHGDLYFARGPELYKIKK